MTLKEQETIIRYDNSRDAMVIYTSNPAEMRRLASLSAYTLELEDRQDGKPVAMTFTASKKLLRLRDKPIKRELTEEQRAANARNLRKAREARS